MEVSGSQDYTLHMKRKSSHPDGHRRQTHGLHVYRLLSKVLEFTDVTCMGFYTTLGIMVVRVLWQGMVPCSISQNSVHLKKEKVIEMNEKQDKQNKTRPGFSIINCKFL